MALDPKLLDSLPDSLVDMYGLVEIDILSDMARRISTYDYFIPAAQHQMQKLQELGAVKEEIIKSLSAMTGKTQAEIVELLTEAGKVAVADDIEYYTRAEVYEPDKVNTEALHKQLNSGLLQTQQAFFNITGTTAIVSGTLYINALDRAWTQIHSGAIDYNTAIKTAITDLSIKGLGSVKYKSGRVDNIEVAVRRAVMTGANQTAAKTQEVLADQLEVDLVEVTAHGGARPSHAKWQGKVFSRKGRKEINGEVFEDLAKATGYGRVDGLCGVNCRHNFHPYVYGTSRTWTDKQLKALEAESVEYNGKKYTEYQASQIQRGIEREIRKTKRTVAALEAAGQDASEYRTQLRNAQKAYTDFTKQTGIKKQPARTQIGAATTKTAPKEEETVVQVIGRSLGAKAKDVLAYNPATGEDMKLTEGSRITQPKNHVIAGAGRERQIDVIDYLLDRYGGEAVKWTKEKGFGYVDDEYGESRRVELHWYQEPTVPGKPELKIKVQPDGSIYLDDD